jgi:hypothetical protein
VLPDSNVYGAVLGLWCPSNPFHSPRRETLYSLPYPLRIERHPSDHPVPEETRTFRAAIDDGVAPEHVEFAATIDRRGRSNAIHRAKSRYRLGSRRAWSLRGFCWTFYARSFPARLGGRSSITPELPMPRPNNFTCFTSIEGKRADHQPT